MIVNSEKMKIVTLNYVEEEELGEYYYEIEKS